MSLANGEREILQLLYREAELLDAGQYTDWLAMMAEDFTYTVPVRITRERGELPTSSDTMQHFSEDVSTLRLRIARLKTEFAWAEDPPSRTRHFVSNVRVMQGASPEELDVRSYLLVWRNRGEAPYPDLISGDRHDVWRRVNDTWKIAKRVIYLDQATLGTKNLGIFL